MEPSLEHFSHKHPLKFCKLDDDEDPTYARCRICGLPILSSASYTCSVDANCNFFLHKACTQLPARVYHRGHCNFLILEQDDHLSYKYRSSSDYTPDFNLHPLVATPMATTITSKHKSHQLHPLVVFCRQTLSLCNGCGEEHMGFFFHCGECDFWIHQDCTVWPSVVKLRSPLHPHPLILTYSVPYVTLCEICFQWWRLRSSGIYLCCECYCFAHPTCVMKNLQTEIREEFLQLPDDDGIFPNSMIRAYVQKYPLMQLDHKRFHEHPLILEDHRRIKNGFCNLVCDLCIQPINNSSPFYRCQFQSNGCHFLAHDLCANHIPSSVKNFGDWRYSETALRNSVMSNGWFNSVFPCSTCLRPSNGVFYSSLRFIVCSFDITCAIALTTIKHASHKQHILYRTYQFVGISISPNCCPRKSLRTIYTCVACDFHIHVRCALLPKKTRHHFDEHPLELIMTSYQEEGYCCFCEFCEEEINQRYWYYGCDKCENYFHIECIPSVGLLSKVKFGKTLVDDNIHRHGLALTRMLTYGRHERCGVCNEIVKGFVDEMAFHCSRCDFWVHFNCAWESAQKSSSTSEPPKNWWGYYEAWNNTFKKELHETKK